MLVTYFYKAPSRFLSTPSARRATLEQTDIGSWIMISIHALCEEGDGNVPCRRWRSIYFYPRPLRGGRLIYSP